MRLGIDISSYLECLEAGASYTVFRRRVDPVSYLHDVNGCDIMRLRLWVNPYDEEGRPYGGGSSDMDSFLRLAKVGMDKGYKILLDFHFSDFWCDPGKQFLPKSWKPKSLQELIEILQNYVESSLKTVHEEGIELEAIQIGNEITNGMLWPYGKLSGEEGSPRQGYDSFIPLLKQGIVSAKKIYPEAKIVIHLERSYDKDVYGEFFDEVTKAKLPFDIIGLSYYPYWHHGFDKFFSNVDFVRTRYGKTVWIVETSYGFTYETACKDSIPFKPLVDKTLFEKGDASEPYPLTQQGQASFLSTLLKKAKSHHVDAIIYWEPLWLPLPGLSWASKEGEEYIHETEKPTTNEWANQCLFDYDGDGTLGLFAFRKRK